MKRAGHWVFRAFLGTLLALGVYAAVERASAVTSADPGAFDRDHVELMVRLSPVPVDAAERARLEREVPRSSANLNGRPHAAVWHVLTGALFFVLVSLQFSRRLRSRHPQVHRWNGRAMLALVTASGLAGMYLGLAQPYGGALESSATTVFGGLFVLFAVRGYQAIRRRDIARHREWMIRMFSIGIGISVIRVLGMANLFLFGTQAMGPRGFALSLWFGWLLSLAVAELWILRTRSRRAPASDHALQPL